MNIAEFYQLSVGIFAVLATLLLVLMIVLITWVTFRVRKILIHLVATSRKFESSADSIHQFVIRNIDYLELQKARLKDFGWFKTILLLLIKK